MIIRGDRRNLQKDKHHWNTPSIWALCRCGQTQSSPQWRCMKTHLEFAKKALRGPSDSEKQDCLEAGGSPSNRTMTLITQQEWLIDNAVNVLEWPSHSLGLNPIKYFWRNLKMCVCPHPTWQSLRRKKMRRRMVDNCQILMCKSCQYPKRLETVKVLQLSTELRVWILIQCAYLIFFMFLLCHYGVWSVDWCGGESNSKQLT